MSLRFEPKVTLEQKEEKVQQIIWENIPSKKDKSKYAQYNLESVARRMNWILIFL